MGDCGFGSREKWEGARAGQRAALLDLSMGGGCPAEHCDDEVAMSEECGPCGEWGAAFWRAYKLEVERAQRREG